MVWELGIKLFLDISNNWFVNSIQYKRGMDVEEFLDKYFVKAGYDIRRTTTHQERILCLGDRIYFKKERQWYIEYKSGIQTYYTGNIFLETISVDTPRNFREGWVFTCQADFIFYAALLNKVILIFRPRVLREMLTKLRSNFREVATSKNQNQGYNTHGLIIPIDFACSNIASKNIFL